MKDILTEFCLSNLNFEIDPRYNFHYSNVPLCVIDSVFSIGVKYESVENVVSRIIDEFKIQNPRLYNNILPDKKSQLSVSDFLDKIKNETTNTLQENYFKNRQRTSTKNGIPKVDAVVLFLKALQNNGVEYLQDLQTAFYNSKLESNIKSIPGQNSGVSLKYFYMLSGFKDLIKPDRMILSFLKDRFNKSFSHDEALVLLIETAVNLSKELGLEITPAFLDNKIWYYQRSKIV